jgi:hypothetical protein
LNTKVVYVSRRICGVILDFAVMKKNAARLNQGGAFLCLTEVIVARGFIPVGLRSSPKTCDFYLSGIPSVEDLRLLRSRTGINPLATGYCLTSQPGNSRLSSARFSASSPSMISC